MAEPATQLDVKTDTPSALAAHRRDWPSFSDLRREMDNLFEDFSRGLFRMPSRFRALELGPALKFNLQPAVDIVESDSEYKITSELPGMDEKNIDVRIAGDVLTITGEKTETKEENERGHYVSERRYGAFERSFTLPEGVDRDSIKASFAKGLLTLTLPKTAEAKVEPKKIDVQAA